nr:U-box domain-containing protein 30-like [Ipomoea batatas]
MLSSSSSFSKKQGFSSSILPIATLQLLGVFRNRICGGCAPAALPSFLPEAARRSSRKSSLSSTATFEGKRVPVKLDNKGGKYVPLTSNLAFVNGRESERTSEREDKRVFLSFGLKKKMRMNQGEGLGQVLDLKDGKKVSMGRMIEELDSIEVPWVFICPISLEPMQDPVTLCTGQTYERSNILKWLSLGHFTCPTTMQELWDDSITPNRTLHHLILTWFSHKYMALKKRSEDVEGRVLEILERLKKVKGQIRVQALKELRQVVNAHDSAKKAVVKNDGVKLICSLLGGFTMHTVASEAIGILVHLDLSSDAKANLAQPSKVSLVVDTLNEGSLCTKINCMKLLEMLMEGKDSDSRIVSSLSLFVGLLRLVKDKNHPEAVLSSLRLLKTITSHESVRTSIVSIGSIPQLVDALPNLNAECLESALVILDVLSTLPEGSLALKDCSRTIPNMVKLLMKVSEKCTQLALSVLWAVCKLAPERCASVAVEAGLAAQLLLVIQSGCNPALKQRSAELLKLCSLNYTATIFISKYELLIITISPAEDFQQNPSYGVAISPHSSYFVFVPLGASTPAAVRVEAYFSLENFLSL